MTQVVNTAKWAGEDSTELDLDVPENSTEEDDKLREYWAKKERRRSSFRKDFVGDTLGLKENQRILMHLTKFGETLAFCVDQTVWILHAQSCSIRSFCQHAPCTVVKLHWFHHIIVTSPVIIPFSTHFLLSFLPCPPSCRREHHSILGCGDEGQPTWTAARALAYDNWYNILVSAHCTPPEKCVAVLAVYLGRLCVCVCVCVLLIVVGISAHANSVFHIAIVV